MDPIALLRALVAINSVNPDLVPGAPGEAAIADTVTRWFERHGFEVHRLEQRAGRPSIVGIARGTGGGRSLMFNGHIDTVTHAGYEGDPLDARIADGKLFGRGSYDMKSGVAAMMAAAARAKTKGLGGDIIVACVADHEHASRGTEEVVEQFSADAAVVTEPSRLDITVAHKGLSWFDVTVAGRAAHGSRPDLGIDAIAKAGKFLVALEQYDRDLRAEPGHALLTGGSVHASLISGGQELSSYPAECRISIERRTLPGETPDLIETQLDAMIAKIAGEDSSFRATVERGLARQPFEIDRQEPIVETLREVATAKLGRAPAWRGAAFWTDCAILQGAGIPCVLFGADGAGAHAATEWATTASVETLADILADVAIRFCSTDAGG